MICKMTLEKSTLIGVEFEVEDEADAKKKADVLNLAAMEDEDFWSNGYTNYDYSLEDEFARVIHDWS